MRTKKGISGIIGALVLISLFIVLINGFLFMLDAQRRMAEEMQSRIIETKEQLDSIKQSTVTCTYNSTEKKVTVTITNNGYIPYDIVGIILLGDSVKYYNNVTQIGYVTPLMPVSINSKSTVTINITSAPNNTHDVLLVARTSILYTKLSSNC